MWVSVGEKNELRGRCVCVWVLERVEEQTDLLNVLCELFSGDNVIMCRPLTCCISQSDLQCRQRDEPTELKGVQVSMRKCRTRVCLVETERMSRQGEERKWWVVHQRHYLWHVRENECSRHNTYHLLLQLIVFPVDQYHRFFEHWWERTHQRLSFDCKCLLGKADWRSATHKSILAASFKSLSVYQQYSWGYWNIAPAAV